MTQSAGNNLMCCVLFILKRLEMKNFNRIVGADTVQQKFEKSPIENTLILIWLNMNYALISSCDLVLLYFQLLNTLKHFLIQLNASTDLLNSVSGSYLTL